MYGNDHEIGITIRELSDIEMLRVMGLENSEDWMNPVQHAHLVVKQARSFFDSWFERFGTLSDLCQALENKSLSEFGESAQSLVQLLNWIGGGDSENNYCCSACFGATWVTTRHEFYQPMTGNA